MNRSTSKKCQKYFLLESFKFLQNKRTIRKRLELKLDETKNTNRKCSLMSGEYDYLFKIIVLGDGAVGKTSLTVRFAHGYFKEDYKMTIGVDFAVKTVSVGTNNGPRTAKLQIWDTGGQERFSYIRPLYYRGAMGALLVYDVTKRESFEHLDNWLEEVGRHCPSIPMIMVGNKTDMPGRAVSLEDALGYAINRNMVYFETSAKEGTNVESAFGDLTRILIDYT